jgi:hypothetical protein
MNKIEKGEGYEHHCLRCNRTWSSRKPNPLECNYCRTKSWNVPIGEKTWQRNEMHIPIPKFDHSSPKNLPFIGAKCPYCRGTTGLDTFRVVAFCYSCDATFSITSGEFVGVLQGIGLR